LRIRQLEREKSDARNNAIRDQNVANRYEDEGGDMRLDQKSRRDGKPGASFGSGASSDTFRSDSNVWWRVVYEKQALIEGLKAALECKERRKPPATRALQYEW
jgi:hypothetical protein